MAAVSVPALADIVRRRAPGGLLDRVAAALAVGEELTSGADELIGYFVAEARRGGCSWTQIGERIGVSKQAARQRFAQLPPLASTGRPQCQPRLLACLEAAGREAGADGAAEIGTHHQLIGLFHEGVAGAVLEKLGVRADAVRTAARELFPAGGQPGSQPPPESAEARQAVQGAASLSQRGGACYVGTEHLLAALALDPGSRARRVLGQLGADFAAIKKELACYVGDDQPRRRRRGKAWPASQQAGGDLACSFCGKPRSSQLRLVTGPGVWICAQCVQLCHEILSEGAEPPAAR